MAQRGDRLQQEASTLRQAMRVKDAQTYDVDPLCCPKCQGEVRVVAFIKPPQGDVIEKILRHCRLWHCSRAPPASDWYRQATEDEHWELTFVDEDTFWSEF